MRERIDKFGTCTMSLCQILLTCRRIEQHIEFIGCFVGDPNNNIGIHHIMNKRNVLVTNALNVVFTKTVFQHGGTLKCFNSNNGSSVNIFEAIASSNCAR